VLANFDDNEGHVVGERAVPPRSHAVENCLHRVLSLLKEIKRSCESNPRYIVD
jgi:hypothetical protein